MIRAAMLRGALFLPIAIASSAACADKAAARPSSTHSAHFDDCFSLVHASFELAIEVESEYQTEAAQQRQLPKFIQVTQGTCEGNGFDQVASAEECREAGESLGYGTEMKEEDEPNRKPSGCLWKFNANRLIWNHESFGNPVGAQWPFHLLCENKHVQPTPSPTLGPCIGDAATFSTPWGDCNDYRPGQPSNAYCEHDEDDHQRTPAQVCPQCDDCLARATPAPGRPSRSPTEAPTVSGMDATPDPTSSFCACPPSYDPVCGTNGVSYASSCVADCISVPIDCNGTCPCEPTLTGDPHVSNLAGEHFDINQPADHVLLRLPLDPSRPALLELRGQVAEVTEVCAMYLKMVTLCGEWFGNSTVQVRSLSSGLPGSMDGAEAAAWPFSIRESTAFAEGAWRSVNDFVAGGGNLQPLSATVSVAAHPSVHEFGSGPEGQAFEVLVGGGAESRASIGVFQGGHQSINLQLKNLKALGERHLGGLLGTEKHNHEVEDKTQQCKASETSTEKWARHVQGVSDRALPREQERLHGLVPDGPRLSASW